MGKEQNEIIQGLSTPQGETEKISAYIKNYWESAFVLVGLTAFFSNMHGNFMDSGDSLNATGAYLVAMSCYATSIFCIYNAKVQEKALENARINRLSGHESIGEESASPETDYQENFENHEISRKQY